MVRGALVAFVLAMLLAATAQTAHAQDSDSAARAGARKLGYEGVEAYQAGAFTAASEKLEKAYAVLRVPSLGLWSARALVKRDKLVEATDRFLEVIRLPLGGGDREVQKRAQNDAQAELDVAQQLTPSLLIQIEGAEASAVSINIDGAHVAPQLVGEASPINPGHHRIEGVAGAQHVVVELTIAPRQQQQAKLRFSGQAGVSAPAEPAANGVVTPSASAARTDDVAPGPSLNRTLGWVALGGGVAGLALGGITGGLAMSKRSKLDENPDCADDYQCPSQLSGSVDSLNTMRTVSTIGFVAGGVLAATGVVLLLTAPQRAPAPSAALWVSPTSAGLSGRF